MCVYILYIIYIIICAYIDKYILCNTIYSHELNYWIETKIIL